MAERSLMIDLDDPRVGKIADVISNKTAKRILGLLSEKEMSESELARELVIPLNTVGYNVKKLKDAGLIEGVRGFLWSVKGRRVLRYKVSNKKIVISPMRMIRGIIPSILISGAIAFGIKFWSDSVIISENGVSFKGASEDVIVSSGAGSASEVASGASKAFDAGVAESASSGLGGIVGSDVWLWFLAGALFGLFVYLVWNLFVRMLKN